VGKGLRDDVARRKELSDYITHIRTRAGFNSDVELATAIQRAGNPRFNSSILSKWRTGASETSLDSLRWIALVCNVPAIDLFLKAELIQPGDIGRKPVHPVYDALAELELDLAASDVPELRGSELDYLRRHASMLLAGVRERFVELSKAGAKPRRRRAAS
jgi:transcriptional regulator with XRE-family HTH domain